jgi:uncharacterized repeat protein (TIGR03803 family)
MKFELKPVEQRLTACTVFMGVVVGLAGFAAPPTQAQTFTVLYNFKPAPDGGTPYGGLLNVNGTFYGTTYGGGGLSDGTVFKLTASDNESVLYSFKGGSDGTHPFYESLVKDSAGNFYGTTFTGGAGGCTPPGCGIVFKLAGKKESVLHSFSETLMARSPALVCFWTQRATYTVLLATEAPPTLERYSRLPRPSRKPCYTASRVERTGNNLMQI